MKKTMISIRSMFTPAATNEHDVAIEKVRQAAERDLGEWMARLVERPLERLISRAVEVALAGLETDMAIEGVVRTEKVRASGLRAEAEALRAEAERIRAEDELAGARALSSARAASRLARLKGEAEATL